MMEFGVFEVLLSVVVIIFVVYIYSLNSTEYWKDLGVPGPAPSGLVGNIIDVFFSYQSMTRKLQKYYDAYKDEPFVGYYVGSCPVLMIKDPELIRDILVKDFNVFPGRGITTNESLDPLAAHLFNLEGARWKVLRNKLTPTFTSGKLKQMFYLMTECADNFERHLREKIAVNNRIEVREQAARYSIDVIGSCAFGIDTQAMANEDSVFRKITRKMFHADFIQRIRRTLREVAPRLYNFLRISYHDPELTNFFIDTMKQTIELRQKTKVVRNDFVDLLLQISKDSAVNGFEWNDLLLTAQAYVFFAAGFETSSSTISFALWELARNQEIQQKLRQELREYDEKNNGVVTYEAVNDMKYLDMVVKETLRKNPPGVHLTRCSTRSYVIPGTNVTLPAGQRVQIPVQQLHTDAKYYPKPDVFDPERFSDEAKQTRDPMVYIPFGDGPKNCIGMRFANYGVKMGLITIIKHFYVKPTTRIDEPYVRDKRSIIAAPLGGFVLELVPCDAG